MLLSVLLRSGKSLRKCSPDINLSSTDIIAAMNLVILLGQSMIAIQLVASPGRAVRFLLRSVMQVADIS